MRNQLNRTHSHTVHKSTYKRSEICNVNNFDISFDECDTKVKEI